MKQGLGIAASVVISCICLPASSAEGTDCGPCAEWNLPHAPFRIHGSTYYVGTAGLSAILITSQEGHILIDGGLQESAVQIAGNISALGFRIEDVRLILNSHAHFDHAGGIAELQRLSGAEVALSPWSEVVLRTGMPNEGDPQYAIVLPIEPVANHRAIEDGDTLPVGPNTLSAHFTPGHTPGGTSWSWQSCEGDVCLDIVYADSLSAVSGDGFRFMDSPAALAGFEESFAALEAVECDILLVPHPGFAGLLEKATRAASGETPNPFIEPNACRNYADEMRDWLDRRLVEERSVVRE